MERNFWLLCLAVLGLIMVGPHCKKDTGSSCGEQGCADGADWTGSDGADGYGADGADGYGADGYGADGSDGVWQDGSGPGGGGTSGGTGGTSVGGADGFGPTCYDCACLFKSTDLPAGCADRCDSALNGGTSDFCNNAPTPGDGCAACIKVTCGVSDPAMCF